MRKRPLALLATSVVAALTLAACGASGSTGATSSTSSTTSTPSGGPRLNGQHLDVLGVWSGDEQKAFESVLALFEQQTGATVSYTSAGDDLPTVLQTKVDGGAAPNVAFLAQPGLIEQFAKKNLLTPLSPDVISALDAHYPPAWKDFGSVGGKPYAVYFKAADKSVCWYSAKAFATAGATPPATQADFLNTNEALSNAGIAPLSVGGADGWVLTDWFENIYLQSAGAQNYDRLSRHEIPWTDPSVKQALTTLRGPLRDDLLAGGAKGTLLTDFPTSVSNVFGDKQTAAIDCEGDFVGGVITSSTKAKLGADALTFPFPSIGTGAGSVVSGGDAAVEFVSNSATDALMKFLASPEAAAVWAKKGGFLSPNKDLPAGTYPDPLTAAMAKQLSTAGGKIRFDMSDLAPTAFGATKGAGEWKDLEDFLANPSDVDGAAAKLEADAAKAFGGR